MKSTPKPPDSEDTQDTSPTDTEPPPVTLQLGSKLKGDQVANKRQYTTRLLLKVRIDTN